MPTYVYYNPETGESKEITCSISELDANRLPAPWLRDWGCENRLAPTGDGGWPMKSDGAGCCPSQIGEMQDHLRQHGVHTDYDKKTGQAIFRNRKHRKDHLKAMGMHDRDGGYGD